VSNAKPQAGQPKTEFFPCLESLRSICALVVALFHIGWTNHIKLIPMMDRAWTFVDFFFVLSGFVISNAYFGKIATLSQTRQFLIKRIFRLYPLHIATLLMVGFVQFASWQWLGRENPFGPHWPWLLALNLTLSHAIGLSDGMILNVPSWSISVELYAYLAFCIICLISRSKTALLATLIASSAVSLVLLISASPDLGLSTPANSSLARGIFGFCLGCLSTLFRRRFSFSLTGVRADMVIMAITCVILMLMAKCSEYSHALFWLPAVFALFIVTITNARGSWIVSFLENRVFRSFGLISYSIYMNHVFILMGFSFLAGRFATGPKVVAEHGTLHAVPLATGDLLTIGFVVTLLVVSWLTYWLIENPGRLIGRRVADRIDIG
jgi:peptidoglycan/LPS O-acetylase OafA/YrhL